MDSINVNTGMSPANVDNAIRSLMSLIRQSFASALQNFFAGTAALPIANGGTGGTDAATARTALGALSSAYRDLVRVDTGTSFIFSDANAANGIWCNGSGIVATIAPQSSVQIAQGAVINIMNGSATASVSVVRGSGVSLYVNGATPSGTGSDAVLAPGAVATLVKWGTDYWTINGVGVS